MAKILQRLPVTLGQFRPNAAMLGISDVSQVIDGITRVFTEVTSIPGRLIYGFVRTMGEINEEISSMMGQKYDMVIRGSGTFAYTYATIPQIAVKHVPDPFYESHRPRITLPGTIFYHLSQFTVDRDGWNILGGSSWQAHDGWDPDSGSAPGCYQLAQGSGAPAYGNHTETLPFTWEDLGASSFDVISHLTLSYMLKIRLLFGVDTLQFTVYLMRQVGPFAIPIVTLHEHYLQDVPAGWHEYKSDGFIEVPEPYGAITQEVFLYIEALATSAGGFTEFQLRIDTVRLGVRVISL